MAAGKVVGEMEKLSRHVEGPDNRLKDVPHIPEGWLFPAPENGKSLFSQRWDLKIHGAYPGVRR